MRNAEGKKVSAHRTTRAIWLRQKEIFYNFFLLKFGPFLIFSKQRKKPVVLDESTDGLSLMRDYQ